MNGCWAAVFERIAFMLVSAVIMIYNVPVLFTPTDIGTVFCEWMRKGGM